jgi:hypothetical protein
MTAPAPNAPDATIIECVDLLTHYSFDLGAYSAPELIYRWQRYYPSNWFRLAIIEALHQGRYKAVSVEQIMAMWSRRQEPHQRFSHEFERMICSKLPRNLMAEPMPLKAAQPAPDSLSPSLSPNASSEKQTASPAVQSTTQPQSSEAQSPESSPAPTQPEHNQPQAKAENSPNQDSSPDRWSKPDVTKEPIRQFHPTVEPSEIYTKLQAVSQQSTLHSLGTRELIVIAEDPPPEGQPQPEPEPEPELDSAANVGEPERSPHPPNS